uniref:Uncharacterized protein n=1 Tax=Trichuris muris TaxID=70415 RepID=A0A5S6Q1Y4_TRIMR
MGIIPGVDFNAYLTMDDELVTCNELDAEYIFEAELSDMREMNASDNDLEEKSGSDTEVEKRLTAADVRHSLHQLKLFVAEKCSNMFNAIVNDDFASTTYVCSNKVKQTTIDSLHMQQSCHKMHRL